MKPRTRNLILLFTFQSTVLASCATVKGSVTPMENGIFKSYVSDESKKDALKMSESDAKITCKKEEGKKYTVISKDVVRQSPKRVNTGINLVDKAINFSQDISELGDNNGTYYEVTTIFKCR